MHHTILNPSAGEWVTDAFEIENCNPTDQSDLIGITAPFACVMPVATNNEALHGVNDTNFGSQNLGIGTDMCQDHPDSVVECTRVGHWSKEIDHGEGSAAKPGFPPLPRWVNDSRDFGNIDTGLRTTERGDGEVAGTLGNYGHRSCAANFTLLI